MLIVLVALPLAGCPGDDDDATTAATTEGGTTTTASTSTASGESSGIDTSSTGPDPATSFPPSDSSSATETVGDQCDGAPTPTLCADYGNHFAIECFPDQADMLDAYVHDCVCGVFFAAIFTTECGAAAEDYYTCVVAAPCADLMDEPCPSEAMAFVDVCGGHSPPELTGG